MNLVLLPLLALVPSEVLQPRLAETLARTPPDAQVPALVVMEERYDVAVLQRDMSRLPRRERPAAVRGLLEPWAEASQAELIAVVDMLEETGDVVFHRLLWNVNAHRVTATPAALERLATVPGVRSVRWDPVMDESELADVAPPPLPIGTPASLPFVTSFESGSIPEAFELEVFGPAQANVTSLHGPSAGTQHLVLDSAPALIALSRAALHLDLAKHQSAILSFDLAKFGSGDNSGTGIWLASGGEGPHLVMDIPADSPYQSYQLNLRQLADLHGLEFTDDFEVHFRWLGTGPAPTDGLALDELSVVSSTIAYPPPTPNITALEAPLLWNLGIEGQGAFILNIDGGTANDHPALANQIWENPGEVANNGVDDDGNGYVDDTWGWDFGSNDNSPYSTGHGTETAGIVMGNGTNNDGVRTGMAPRTTMAVAKISGEGAGLESYQYAVAIGVDCITSSYSFKWPSQPDYELFRIATEVELAAGIIHANSLGNQGNSTTSYPIPYNIATPGNCPGPWRHPQQVAGGVASVLGCAGIYLGTDELYTSSGQGPSTWEDPSVTSPGYPFSIDPALQDYPHAGGALPGLLKPDLSTYTNVKTTIGSSDYTDSFGGTSAATPHLGGALCLLIDANESVPPRHIAQALQATAVDLGDPGKDLRFGAGKVQVYEAAKRIIAAPTAYPHLPAVGEVFDLQVTGPAGSPYLLLFSFLQGSLPTTLGIEVGLGSPLTILSTGLHAGVDAPTSLPIPLPNDSLLSGFELHFQVITNDTNGLTGEWLASVVETVTIQ